MTSHNSSSSKLRRPWSRKCPVTIRCSFKRQTWEGSHFWKRRSQTNHFFTLIYNLRRILLLLSTWKELKFRDLKSPAPMYLRLTLVRVLTIWRKVTTAAIPVQVRHRLKRKIWRNISSITRLARSNPFLRPNITFGKTNKVNNLRKYSRGSHFLTRKRD